MFGIYNKFINLIFSYLFPVPKPTKEDKLLRVMGEYLKLITDVPFDDFNIKLHDKELIVEIHLIYDTWERTYLCIKQEHIIERDMNNMFPYTFIVNAVASYMN
jgi:predicted nuclease of restriction endonuclease-like RecB superfamily